LSLPVENDILDLRMKKKKIEKPQSDWVARVGNRAKILVKKGQKVAVGDVLALKERKKTKKAFFPSWLKKNSGIWAKGGKKVVGEKVEVDEVLYEKTSFPKKSLTWLSPVRGEITNLHEEKGYLEILIGKEEEKLISPVSGTVAKAGKGEIQISFLAQELKGEGLGEGVGWGRLTVLENQLLATLSADHEGQVLVVEEISASLIEKGRALGVVAFIAFAKESELTQSSLPVLIFSFKKGKKGTRLELISLAGQYCFVSPANNQILICLEGDDEKEKS